jgi:hypothetical protein
MPPRTWSKGTTARGGRDAPVLQPLPFFFLLYFLAAAAAAALRPPPSICDSGVEIDLPALGADAGHVTIYSHVSTKELNC